VKAADPYNLQADGLLHGRLDLPVDIPQGFRELPDPFDSVANTPYRAEGLHDLSYYDGKLYSYFGPTPTVLLFLPYRLLHIGDLSMDLANLIFATTGYIVLLLAVLRLRRCYLPTLPDAADVLIAIALGLGVPLPFMLYLGRFYELAITAGFARLSAAFYFGIRAWQARDRRRWLFLSLAWTALAVAVGPDQRRCWRRHSSGSRPWRSSNGQRPVRPGG
jgi:hypothetical protein